MFARLLWENADNGEAYDQNATSSIHPHSYWAIGPDANNVPCSPDGTFSVELIVKDERGDEISALGQYHGSMPNMEAAYRKAQREEDHQNETGPLRQRSRAVLQAPHQPQTLTDIFSRVR